MENVDFFSLFQGFGTMVAGGWILAVARVFLITLGGLLVYLGWKGVLEPVHRQPSQQKRSHLKTNQKRWQ